MLSTPLHTSKHIYTHPHRIYALTGLLRTPLYQDVRLVQISLVFVAGFVAILFCATSDVMLLVGELLLGFPLGTINTIAPAYCLEVVPLALRHYGPTYINLCWAFGHILGTGVLRAYVNDTSQWAWRIPYAVQVRCTFQRRF